LIGGSPGDGISFAQRFFRGDEIELNPGSNQIFARERLQRRQLAVVEAHQTTAKNLREWVATAKEYHAFSVAIVLARGSQAEYWRTRNLEKEGFKDLLYIETLEKRKQPKISRVPLWPDKRHLTGPFDIIGDVHGCAEELSGLLGKLGYEISWYEDGSRTCFVVPPAGRMAVFLGDFSGAGPNEDDVMLIVRALVAQGSALCIWGDTDDRKRKAVLSQAWSNPGYRDYVQEFDPDYSYSKERAKGLLNDVAVSHLWLDGGDLVVAHAAIREDMIGRSSNRVRDFCIYGEESKTSSAILTNQLTWVESYQGAATVVYGHTPCAKPTWRNNTIGLNTDCVCGGALTALRWPERELVSVPALRNYSEA
jgi:protein phosphatase